MTNNKSCEKFDTILIQKILQVLNNHNNQDKKANIKHKYINKYVKLKECWIEWE